MDREVPDGYLEYAGLTVNMIVLLYGCIIKIADPASPHNLKKNMASTDFVSS